MADEEDKIGPRVVELPDKPDPHKAIFEQVKRQLPTIIENADMLAQIRKANYDALLRAGFTETQALELCWK